MTDTRSNAPRGRRKFLAGVAGRAVAPLLLNPRERAEIAFVADNPGDWMFHCHVLDHQASGMMSCIRVT